MRDLRNTKDGLYYLHSTACCFKNGKSEKSIFATTGTISRKLLLSQMKSDHLF